MEITQEDRRVWVEGRDAVINFRAEFCGAPTLETVLGDMENYTEYAEECEALADRVRIASEQAVLAKLRDLSDETVTAVFLAVPTANSVRKMAAALADVLEQKP